MKQKESRKSQYCSNKKLSLILDKVTKELLYEKYITLDLDRKDVCNELGITLHELCVLLDYYQIKKDMSMRMKKTRARQLANMTPEKLRAIKQKELRTKAAKSDHEKKAIKEKTSNTIQKLKREHPEKYWANQQQRNKTHSITLKNKSQQFWVDRYNKFITSIKLVSAQSVEKNIQTRRKNKTFNSSKVEIYVYEYLKQKYRIKEQYKNDKYPFRCDIYIEDLNIYLEINAHWTHGKHPFNSNDEDDIRRLDIIKSKQTEYLGKSGNMKHNSYFIAEKVWTKMDPLKINYAKNNNLDYIVLYNINIRNMTNICNLDFKKFIGKGITIIDFDKGELK